MLWVWFSVVGLGGGLLAVLSWCVHLALRVRVLERDLEELIQNDAQQPFLGSNPQKHRTMFG